MSHLLTGNKWLSHRAKLLVTGLFGLVFSSGMAFFVLDKQEAAWQQRFDIGVLRRQHAIENTLRERVPAVSKVRAIR